MKRLCGCGRLVEKGDTCVCQVAARAERLRKADARRGSPAQRGYDSAWRAVRQQALSAHPQCECGQPATEVHHLKSVRERPDLRLEMSNLKCLCRTCHSRITAKTQAFGRHAFSA